MSDMKDQEKQLVEWLSDMNEDDALALAKRMLLEEGADPLRVLELCRMGMDIVGKRFEDGEYFLPELVLAGEPIDAETALRIGLANRVFEPDALLGSALAIGEKVASKGPFAVALAKRVMQEGQDADLRTAHALEQKAFGLVFASTDRAEGMDAFLAKREPAFQKK